MPPLARKPGKAEGVTKSVHNDVQISVEDIRLLSGRHVPGEGGILILTLNLSQPGQDFSHTFPIVGLISEQFVPPIHVVPDIISRPAWNTRPSWNGRQTRHDGDEPAHFTRALLLQKKMSEETKSETKHSKLA